MLTGCRTIVSLHPIKPARGPTREREMAKRNRFYLRSSALALLVPILTAIGAPAAMAHSDVSGATNDGGPSGSENGNADDQGASASPADDDSISNGEITVTARRRSEALSRVPISITSLAGAEITQRNVSSQSDLQRTVPGLTIRTGQSDNVLTFTIRGQGVDTFSSSQPAVLTYFNEVPLSSYSASNFYDLESIQVLKGPQGTLFGRNTTGGAVLYTSAKPKDQFEGYVSAGIGNYNDRRLEGVLNLPLGGDKAILRLAGNAQWRDGWQKNVTTGQEQGQIDRQSLRVTLALRPSDGFESTFVGGYSWLGGTNVGLYTYAVYPCGATNNGIPLGSIAACTFGPANPGYGAYLAANPNATPAGIVDQVAIQRALGTRQVNGTARTARTGRDWFVVNTSTFELGSDATLKNIVSYSKSKVNNLWDPFGTGNYVVARIFSTPDGDPGTINGFDQNNESFTEELQLSGSMADGSLKYLVGGFYSWKRDYYRAPFQFFDFRPVFGPFPSQNEFNSYAITKAFYAQATYDLSDTGLNGLKVTGGFRYTWEDARLNTLPGSTNPGLREERASFSDPSWTIGLDWQATDQLLLYVAQRGSFRAGGFNGVGPLQNTTAEFGGNLFLPEKVRDVEAGAKFAGRLGTMPLRANLAVYTSTITDVQRAQFVILPSTGELSTLTVNIPSARVRGFEFDTSFEPSDNLEIGGNVAYTDARYTRGSSTVFGTTYNYGPYADTPEWAGSAFFKVKLPTNGAGDLSFRGEVYAQSAQFFSNLGDTLAPGTKLPPYAVVNATFDWKNAMGGPVDLTVFVKNAFQKSYFTGGFGFPPLGLASATPAEPRTFGVTAKVRF